MYAYTVLVGASAEKLCLADRCLAQYSSTDRNSYSSMSYVQCTGGQYA